MIESSANSTEEEAGIERSDLTWRGVEGGEEPHHGAGQEAARTIRTARQSPCPYPSPETALHPSFLSLSDLISSRYYGSFLSCC